MRLLALLPLVLLGAAAAAGDPGPLEWRVDLPREVSHVGAIPLRAFLHNVSQQPLRFTAADDRPPLELVLTPEGKEPVRKPLPAKAEAHRTPGTLQPMAYAWLVFCDLREGFGRLEPGRYTLSVVHPAKGYTLDRKAFKPVALVSEPVLFEVVKATLEDARKGTPATGGVSFEVKEKDGATVGVLTNESKGPLALWAYGDQPGQPLDGLVLAEYWTGRGWHGVGGGFCGTGLVEVVLAPGASRGLRLPPYDDGIVRFTVDLRLGGKSLNVPSTPILRDTFGK